MTTRPTNHISYGPGKFEGESCITRFAYFLIMIGDGKLVGDEIDSEFELHGPFTVEEVNYFEQEMKDTMCQECLDDLLNMDNIHYWEDSNGFAYSTTSGSLHLG